MINPLQMAIKNRNIEAVKGLLDITVMTSEIATDLLITAIQANEKSSSDPLMLEYLLDSGFAKYINDMHTKSGMTVLQNACLEGDIFCVEVLLANNANKSIRDKMGHTALHKACKSSRLGDGGSRLPLVYLLLGIDPTIEGGWCIRPERLLEIENTENAPDVHLSFASDGTILDVPLKDTGKESSKDPNLFPLNASLRTDPKPPPLGGESLTDLNPDPLNPLTTSLDLLTDPLETSNPLIDILENPDPSISSKREEKIEMKEIGEVYKDIKKVDNENPRESKRKKIDEFIVNIASELNVKGTIKYEHGCLSIYAYV
jgi:ankyrin repeat protein